MDETMSTSENAPVSYYGDNGIGSGASAALLAGIATRDNYNPVDMVSATGVSDLRAEVSNSRWILKDAESNIRRDIAKSESEIRSDVLREGQDNIKTTMGAECNLSKEIMENKFALTKEVLETKHTLNSEIIKQGYENKLLQKDTVIAMDAKFQHLSERLGDKMAHGFEEINEKLCECCGEAALAAANTQNGLVNIQNLLSGLVSAAR